MKKATLSIGLFTLIMVLTSFTTPETPTTSNTVISSIDGSGSQSTGGNRKIDFHDIDGSGSQSTGGNRKIDFHGIDGSGSQSTGGNRKID